MEDFWSSEIATMLTDDEREFLRFALGEWGGPASYAPLPINDMGFGSWAEFDRYLHRIRERLRVEGGTASLSDSDWARVLFLAEISFASDLIGSGVDWYGVPDEQAIRLLRSLQTKLSSPGRSELVFPNRGQARIGPLPGEGVLPGFLAAAESPLETQHPEHFRPTYGMWLTLAERAFIWHALSLWGGPASRKPLPLAVVGFDGWDDLDQARHRFQLVMSAGDGYQVLSDKDLARMLFLTELAWGSELLGAGRQFSQLTGIRDDSSVTMLRDIQRKISSASRADLLLPGRGRRVPDRMESPPADP